MQLRVSKLKKHKNIFLHIALQGFITYSIEGPYQWFCMLIKIKHLNESDAAAVLKYGKIPVTYLNKCWDANRRPHRHEHTVKRPTWSGEKGFWCVTDVAQSNQQWLRLVVTKRCEQKTSKALSWQKFSHASPQLCSTASPKVTNHAGNLDTITWWTVSYLYFCKTTV